MTNRSPRHARALAGLLAAGVLVGVAVPAAASMPAANDDDGHVPGLSVAVVGDLPAFATPQTTYTVLTTASSTLRALTDVSLAVEVTDAPFADSAALGDFLNEPDAAPRHAVASTPLGGTSSMRPGQLDVGATIATSATVAPGALGLSPGASGVYGVVVELRVGDAVAWRQVSPLTWQPRALPNLDVSVLASITGSSERVTSLLTAASDERVALAVEPAALSLAQRLTLSRREAYALPAGNLDVSSAAHAAAGPLVETALAAGREGLDLPWIAVAAAADDATVGLASVQGALAVVADTRWATPPSDAAVVTVTAIDDVTPAPLVLPDPTLSRTLANGSPSDSTTTARLYAEAAFAATRGAGSVVIAPGDAWVVDGSRPSRAIEALFSAPFVTPRALSAQLSDADRPEVDLPEAIDGEGDIPAESVVASVTALSSLTTLTSATDGSSAMIAKARAALFASLGLAGRSDTSHRADAIAEALAGATVVTDAVSVTSGSDLLLVSRSGAVPITVHNGLDTPVTVKLAITSRSPILVTKAQPVAVIDANADATIKVPVEAVSSGDVSVSVALRTESGATIAVAETLKVRVRAAWGSAATGIVTAGLVVLFVAGIVRTVRRGRRDTRVVPSPTTPVAGASEDDA